VPADVCPPGADGAPSRRLRNEAALVGLTWAMLALGSLWVFPVANLPASVNSWDVLHSGRRFAEQGFLAGKLQPRWMPLNDRAPYLTYTHYPPLPYWISGVVQSAVADPQRRIRAMLRVVRVVGFTTLACGYLLLRQLGIGVGAGAVAIALLAGSQYWWWWVSGELTWCSWFSLFLFGALTVFAWGLHRNRTRWRIALLASAAGWTAAALCAFEAWLWAPTFCAVLFLLIPHRATLIRRRLLIGLVFACAATGIGAGTRLAVNWWHFGSLDGVVQDLRQAYGIRSTVALSAGMTHENVVNYFEVQHSSATGRWAWISRYFRSLPDGLEGIYLPPAPTSRWIVGLSIVLAVPTWWAALTRRRQRQAARRDDVWPSSARALVAVAVAPAPYVLAVPAINVQQLWCILALAPAVLLALGCVFAATLTTVERAGRWLGALGRPLIAALAPAAVLATLAVLVTRAATPRGIDWFLPIEECQTAARAVSGMDGVVFVNLPETNPLMYLVPLDSAVALKPVAVLGKKAFPESGQVRLLYAESFGRGRDELLRGAEAAPLPGLPAGWRLLIAERAATP